MMHSKSLFAAVISFVSILGLYALAIPAALSVRIVSLFHIIIPLSVLSSLFISYDQYVGRDDHIGTKYFFYLVISFEYFILL